MIFEDDEGQPEKAITVVSKLIDQDKVVAVLGEVPSTLSLAAAPVAQKAKIPMITLSTNPKVTQVGDYISRICFIDPLQGIGMAKFAINSLNAKTAAILSDANSDYSKSLTDSFKKEFTKLGGQIVSEQTYLQTDPNFKMPLTEIRRSAPDIIYIPGYYAQAGTIVRQARGLGMNMPLLGGDGWDSPQLWELGGNSLKNTYITYQYSADNPAQENQNFVQSYKARFGIAPDIFAALGYESAKVLIDAMNHSGGTESEELRDAINSTKNFTGLSGTITLDSSRNALKPILIQALEPTKKAFSFKESVRP